MAITVYETPVIKAKGVASKSRPSLVLPTFTQALPDTRNILSHQLDGKPSMAIALVIDALMMIKGEGFKTKKNGHSLIARQRPRILGHP
jgi:hypothetical protein